MSLLFLLMLWIQIWILWILHIEFYRINICICKNMEIHESQIKVKKWDKKKKKCMLSKKHIKVSTDRWSMLIDIEHVNVQGIIKDNSNGQCQ